MKVLSLFLFVIMLPLQTSFSKVTSNSAVWGKVVETNQKISGINYKYFIYYERDKVAHAYPVDTKRKDIADAIKKSVGQNIRIEGEVKPVTLQIDGPKKVILVFIPTMIMPLSLSELAINDPVDVRSHMPVNISQKNKEYEGGGIRINDDVANAMIYTGAAAILGTQIKNLLSK